VTRAESVTWGKPRRIAEAARPVRLTLFPLPKGKKPEQIPRDRYKINGQGERCANEKIVGQPEGRGHEKDDLHPRR
jgi:hypothetical protein